MQTAFDLEALEAESDALIAMSTRDLIALARGTEDPGAMIAIELAYRLERYAEEAAVLEDELRAARGIPRKQPGKVVDLRTRRTLN